MNYKPGGGNHPQPFVPKGNGEKNGEYIEDSDFILKDKGYKNIKGYSNPCLSDLVKNTTRFYERVNERDIPTKYTPNSVIKKIIDGYVVMERYYNENGDVFIDIDYTNHGNPKTHPIVPHMHHWKKENGKFIRFESEDLI